MTKSKDQLIKMAFAAHPHGIKGEVEFRLLNPNQDESVLDDDMDVWLFPAAPKSKIPEQGQQWHIVKLRFGNKVICQLDGIRDRTHLETLLPFEIFLDRESFPDVDDGEVYLVDLIDMMVVAPSGEELGKLESFSDNGMQYLFEVRLVNGELITLPYVDAFFPNVDVENKKITMIMPEFTE